MTIKVQCADLWARRLSRCLRSSVAKLAVGIVLLAAATAAWSWQQNPFPYTVIHKFPPPSPNSNLTQQYALGNLVVDTSGRLSVYGATATGGTGYSCDGGCGIAFKLSHGTFTDLYNFFSYPPTTPPSSYTPSSGLLRDKAGNLYGETQNGGSGGYGAVYTIDTNGNQIVLASFDRNEANPVGGLIQDQAGDLLGVTNGGGTFAGEIFKVDLAGNKTVLYTFPADRLSGSYPNSALVVDKEGNIFGTTFLGGANLRLCSFGQADTGCGVLFKLSPDGTATVLHNFTGKADGALPGGLAMDGEGNLIGYTASGGNISACSNYVYGGCGVIFKYDTHRKFSILHSFVGTDGLQPSGVPLLLNGSIYGATFHGGNQAIRQCSGSAFGGGCGVVFRLSPSGVMTVLHTFINTDGSSPSTGLVTDGKGNLFGATQSGFVYRVLLPQ